MGGKNSTHVANKSGSDIWAKVATERSHLTNLKVSSKVGGEFEGVSFTNETGVEMTWEWNKFISDGFNRIGDNSFFRFDYGDDDSPFVSILSKKYGVIADSVRLDNDYSVYIDEDGYMRNTEHGRLFH